MRQRSVGRFKRVFLIESLLHQNDTARSEAEMAILIGLNPNERDALERWLSERRKSQGR